MSQQEDAHPPANQMLSDTSQDDEVVVGNLLRDITNNIWLSQDMLEHGNTPLAATNTNSQPPRPSKGTEGQQKNKQNKKNKTPHMGMTPKKNKPSKQIVMDINNESMAKGHGGTNTSSSSTPTTVADQTIPKDNPILTTTPRPAIDAIKQLLNIFVQSNGKDKTRLDSLAEDLRQFYLTQMRLRDKAAIQLRNVQYAKDRSGRVLAGM